ILAREPSAVPGLARPPRPGLEAAGLDRTIGELAGLGLAGAEAVYGRYSPEERQLVADLARRHGLVVTGGSDYHGTYKPDLQIGVGRGDLDVDDAVLDELAARRGR